MLAGLALNRRITGLCMYGWSSLSAAEATRVQHRLAFCAGSAANGERVRGAAHAASHPGKQKALKARRTIARTAITLSALCCCSQTPEHKGCSGVWMRHMLLTFLPLQQTSDRALA